MPARFKSICISEGQRLLSIPPHIRMGKCQASRRIFFGHEYTEGNLLFAKHMLPDHDVIAQRLEVVREVRSKGGVTVPTTIHDEKETNIFLMCDDDDVLQALGMQGVRPEVAFGEVRTRKNSF